MVNENKLLFDRPIDINKPSAIYIKKQETCQSFEGTHPHISPKQVHTYTKHAVATCLFNQVCEIWKCLPDKECTGFSMKAILNPRIHWSLWHVINDVCSTLPTQCKCNSSTPTSHTEWACGCFQQPGKCSNIKKWCCKNTNGHQQSITNHHWAPHYQKYSSHQNCWHSLKLPPYKHLSHHTKTDYL